MKKQTLEKTGSVANPNAAVLSDKEAAAYYYRLSLLSWRAQSAPAAWSLGWRWRWRR